MPQHDPTDADIDVAPPHRARRQLRRPKRWAWRVGFSLLITIVAAAIVATLLADDAQRWLAMRRIHSANEQTMLRGLTFIYHHADEPAVRSEVSRLLVELDDPVLRDRLILVMQRAGVWGPAFGRGWLESIERRIDTADDPEARALIASALTQHAWARQPIVFEPRFADVIEPLLHDGSALVRQAALRAAASLPSTNRPIDWFIDATKDDQPAIARSAWLFMGLMGHAASANTSPTPRFDRDSVDWPRLDQLLEMPAGVAEACLWAEGQWPRSGPESTAHAPRLAGQVIDQAATPDSLRAFALYALADDPQAVDWPRLIDQAPLEPGHADHLIGWRAVLAAPLTDDVVRALERLIDRAATVGEPADALAAAAICRIADRLPSEPWRQAPGYTLRQLARRECRSVGSAAFPLDPVMPELARLLTIRANRGAAIDDLAYLFNSDEPAIRHYAALVAVQRFEQEACQAMANRLLEDFYDDARMAGAMLGGLSDMPAGRIAQALDREKAWLVRQHLQLGLMMVGANDAFAQQARGLLIRRDMPRSAVLIALLHAGQISALDDLLMPLGRDDGAIRRMLDEQRFGPFLARYLPGCPHFELYADPALGQFQVDLIRHWYLMQRGRLHFDPAMRIFSTSESAG